jgi:hypothetical protein
MVVAVDVSDGDVMLELRDMSEPNDGEEGGRSAARFDKSSELKPESS